MTNFAAKLAMRTGFSFHFFVAIVLVVFTLLSGGQPAQARGRGDFQETLSCPAGQFLVGLYGHTGSWVDQIGLVCARFVQPSYSAGPQVKMPARGGTGGGPNEKFCDPDSAIRSGAVDVTDGGGRVANIKFSCFRPRDGSFAVGRIFGGTEQGYDDQTFGACAGSDYATGLMISYGADVNSAMLICGPFESESSASPYRLPSHAILNTTSSAPSKTSTAAHAVKIHSTPSALPTIPATSTPTSLPNSPSPSVPGSGTAPTTPAPTSPLQDILSGQWQGNVAYAFQQNGNSFGWWSQTLQETANGTIDGDQLNVSWTGPNGNGGMQGHIVSRDVDGRATQIQWSNGQLWVRAN